MRGLALAATLAGLVPLNVTSAQNVTSGLEAGAVRMQYADSIDATAVSLTPTVWSVWNRASFGGAGTFSQFTDGAWTVQGAVAGSVFTPRAGKIAGELVAFAGGSAHQDGARTSQGLGVARVHAYDSRAGVWLGAGLGTAWDGDVWRNVRQAELGAWARFDQADLTASITPVGINDSIRYTDAQIALNVGGGRVDAGATAGFRVGDLLPAFGGSAKSWGSIHATLWLSSWVGLVGNAGTYPVDFTQGFPGGRFAFIGLRVSSRRDRQSESRSRPLLLAPDPEIQRTRRAGARAFTLSSSDDTYRIITVVASARSGVELIGDFTEWQPVQLNAAGGDRWTTTLSLAPGIYEVNIRIDGGPWLVPPGLASSSDEFSGAVGILVVR
jgi:hypothetical protein